MFLQASVFQYIQTRHDDYNVLPCKITKAEKTVQRDSRHTESKSTSLLGFQIPLLLRKKFNNFLHRFVE